jgi:mpaB/rubber oxygenase-like protein
MKVFEPSPNNPVTARDAARVERLRTLRTEMDPLADEAVTALAEYSANSGRQMVATALEHGIDQVPDAPEPLRALFAQLDNVPLWVDWDELNRGGATTLRCGIFGIVALLCYALPLAYASPEGNKPLALSGRMVDHAHRRIAETGRFVLEICRPHGLQRWANGFKLTVTIRLMHAQVRRALLRSGVWSTGAWGAPINQVDMTGTTLLLSVLLLNALRRMGAHFSSDEAHAVIQLWRYSGYLLGVSDELLCASEPEARRLAGLVCLSPSEPDEHSRELVSALFETQFDTPAGRLRWPLGLYQGLARGLIGDQLADSLSMPRLWYGPLLLAGVRMVLPLLEVMRRSIPGMNGWATVSGHRLWSQCVEYAQC